LNWLLQANQMEANRQHHFRDALEEEEMLMMRHPISTRRAYALFGMLLGLFPPAAIFFKLFGGASNHYFSQQGWLLLLLFMNAACCLAGAYLGSKLSRIVMAVERDSWSLTLIESVMIGFIWGAGTGALGGIIAFGIGALFGAICAIPVGALAFGLFMPLHRLLARGGMIDARHFWPLACGVVMIITVLILRL
jgi:hypothetical protein